MIVPQTTIQPFTNISSQIKGIEIRGRKEDPKQNSNIKIQSFTGITKETSKRVLMQILPVKVKTIDGRTTTYALLDNGSQSTLIRSDFVKGSKLKGYKKTISISSAIDEVEEVKVEEVSLRIQDVKEENELHISALTLPKTCLISQYNLF